MNIISLCELQNSSPTLRALPSWVPDLSIFKHIRLPIGCQASGNSRHICRFFKSGKVLHATGIIVDAVKSLSQVISIEAKVSEILAIYRSWGCLNLPSTLYTGGENTMKDTFGRFSGFGELTATQY
jgi:hypothetical protein